MSSRYYQKMCVQDVRSGEKSDYREDLRLKRKSDSDDVKHNPD